LSTVSNSVATSGGMGTLTCVPVFCGAVTTRTNSCPCHVVAPHISADGQPGKPHQADEHVHFDPHRGVHDSLVQSSWVIPFQRLGAEPLTPHPRHGATRALLSGAECFVVFRPALPFVASTGVPQSRQTSSILHAAKQHVVRCKQCCASIENTIKGMANPYWSGSDLWDGEEAAVRSECSAGSPAFLRVRS